MTRSSPFSGRSTLLQPLSTPSNRPHPRPELLRPPLPPDSSAPTTGVRRQGTRDTEQGASHMETLTPHSAKNGSSTTTLLERAAAGDQVAWTQLVDRYDRLVRSVAGS